MYKKFIIVIFIIISFSAIYFGRYVDEYECENNFYDFRKKTGLLGFDHNLSYKKLIEIEFKDAMLEGIFNKLDSPLGQQFTGDTDLKIGNMKGWILPEWRVVNYRITKKKLEENKIEFGMVPENKKIIEVLENRHKFYEFGQGNKQVFLKRDIKFNEESEVLTVYSKATDTADNYDFEWFAKFREYQNTDTISLYQDKEKSREFRKLTQKSIEWHKTAKVFFDGVSSTTTCKLKSTKLKLDFK